MPVEVSTPEELDAVRDDGSGSYVQVANIDLSGWGTWIPIDPFSGFDGTYDGNGYEISGLTVDTSTFAGLFEELDGGIIENVTLVNPDITSSNDWDAGTLVGFHHSGTIRNCEATNVSVTATSTQGVGGLIGFVGNSGPCTVIDCYSDGTVDGDVSVGGLIGEVQTTVDEISQSSTSADVTGTTSVGGFVGRTEDAIERSYCTGSAEGEDEVGGFVGITLESVIEECYSTATVNIINSSTADGGGFVGSGEGTFGPSEFYDCWSGGEVTADGNQDIAGFAGSLTGEFFRLDDCFTYSSLSGGDPTAFAHFANPSNAEGSGAAYYDETVSGSQSSSSPSIYDIVGLTTSEMQGSAAESNMDLGFGDTWITVEDPDDYPIQIAFSPIVFFEGVGIGDATGTTGIAARIGFDATATTSRDSDAGLVRSRPLDSSASGVANASSSITVVNLLSGAGSATGSASTSIQSGVVFEADGSTVGAGDLRMILRQSVSAVANGTAISTSDLDRYRGFAAIGSGASDGTTSVVIVPQVLLTSTATGTGTGELSIVRLSTLLSEASAQGFGVSTVIFPEVVADEGLESRIRNTAIPEGSAKNIANLDSRRRNTAVLVVTSKRIALPETRTKNTVEQQ